jgi:L-cysteine desulfidase
MWVEVTLSGEGHTTSCTLAHKHDRVEKIVVDGKAVFAAPAVAAGSGDDPLYDEIRTFDMQTLWNFAQNVDDAEIATILEGAKMNMTVSEAGMAKNWGFGAGVERSDEGMGTRIHQAAAAASEVRMAGGDFPVMSSAGSGNKGVTAIIPLVIAAREFKKDDKTLARAFSL